MRGQRLRHASGFADVRPSRLRRLARGCSNPPVSTDGNGKRDPVSGIDQQDGSVVVSLAGELDLYNAPQLRTALLAECAAAPQLLVVDLSEVDFIDSTALGVLIEARRRLGRTDAFRLAAPGLETRRALRISGLDRHFAVHDTVDGALSAEA
jgi:anti-sigma B factor antagonist